MSKSEYDHWYRTQRWRNIRRRQLIKQPLCEVCLEGGIVREACVVHHLKPHRGNKHLFWCGPLQSVCDNCHNSKIQREERRGVTYFLHDDGWLEKIKNVDSAGGRGVSKS